MSSCFEIHTADALAKGRQVSLIIVETTGAVLHAEHAISMLLSWQDEGRAKGATDRTIYGSARTATTSYFAHHLRLTTHLSRRRGRRPRATGRPLGKGAEIEASLRHHSGRLHRPRRLGKGGAGTPPTMFTVDPARCAAACDAPPTSAPRYPPSRHHHRPPGRLHPPSFPRQRCPC